MKTRLRVRLDTGKVWHAIRNASITSLKHGAGAIRKTASASIKKRKKAKRKKGTKKRRRKGARAPRYQKTPGAGQPPMTKSGRLKRAFRFYVDPKKNYAIIGPDAELVGDSGKAHEFGGKYRGEKYDKRPFMGPSLKKNLSRLPRYWANSIRSG